MITKDEISKLVRAGLAKHLSKRLLDFEELYEFLSSESAELDKIYAHIDAEFNGPIDIETQQISVWQVVEAIIQNFISNGQVVSQILEVLLDSSLGPLQMYHKLAQARRAELSKQALASDAVADEAICPDCGLCLLSAKQIAQIEEAYSKSGGYPCCIDQCHCK